MEVVMNIGGNTAKSQAIREKVRQFEAQGRHGWCKPEKADILIDLVAELKPVLAVEIGVYGGASLIPIALAMRDYECGRVIGIDPWRTEDCLKNMTRPENRKWWSSLNLDHGLLPVLH
jgi:predicted O-methyltransferase YrrM